MCKINPPSSYISLQPNLKLARSVCFRFKILNQQDNPIFIDALQNIIACIIGLLNDKETFVTNQTNIVPHKEYIVLQIR